MSLVFICLLSCVGRGLCDGLITRPEESYRVSNCVSLINLKGGGGQGPISAVGPLVEWIGGWVGGWMDGWMDGWIIIPGHLRPHNILT
jgi:hypothetical protein